VRTIDDGGSGTGRARLKVYAPEVVPLSLCDYIGEPACVVFFSGCNNACGYCQNSRLMKASEEHLVDLDVIEDSIRRNKLISACKVTGGEPLLQPDALEELGRFVKSLDLKFGVDTNGTLPKPLKDLLPLLDLVSIDVKTSLNEEAYSRITGIPNPCVGEVGESLSAVLSSDAYCDVRMVVIPGVNDSEDVIRSVAGSLKSLGYEEKASKGKAFQEKIETLDFFQGTNPTTPELLKNSPG
jgi:pyruvate formate lyase activating enzyme